MQKHVISLLSLTLVLYRLYAHQCNSRRKKQIPQTKERVVILGASSGIGREIAEEYAARGAKVCIVARRETMVDEVFDECVALRPTTDVLEGILGCIADFSSVEDMVRLRNLIAEEWGGLDTLIVAAGVSALRPLLSVAGLESTRTKGQPEKFDPPEADQEAIQKVVDISLAATRGNYTGPLVAAVTFIPMLSATSKSPTIQLINSLASLIPAPTRSIYASTKSASLLLYQALAIEHPSITFSLVIPSTVEGDFRASAIDGGNVREQDPNKHGLKKIDVAKRCVLAVDRGEKRVWLPGSMRWAHQLYWLIPSFVESRARVKYGFNS